MQTMQLSINLENSVNKHSCLSKIHQESKSRLEAIAFQLQTRLFHQNVKYDQK